MPLSDLGIDLTLVYVLNETLSQIPHFRLPVVNTTEDSVVTIEIVNSI